MIPHEVLGIAENASEETAIQAYKRLASVHHPDKAGGSTAKFQELGEALKRFKRVRPCPLCKGHGVVEVRRGMAVTREKCPHCWRSHGNNR